MIDREGDKSNASEQSDVREEQPAGLDEAEAEAPGLGEQKDNIGASSNGGAVRLSDERPLSEHQQSLLERAEKGRVKWMTSKREFRARAHSNPLNDGLFNPPATWADFSMEKHFVNPPTSQVVWCDIGCGYGGLLASLSAAFPDKTMLGLEIRDRVAEFCRQRVVELRKEFVGEYGNVSFDRTNVMKFLPHYFQKGSLEKMFFCYPDPHFKKKKNRQRIISTQLLAEYAYVLREDVGIVYIVTDVEELFEWMVDKLEKHPLFEKRSEMEHRADIISAFVRDMTDEAHRVDKSDRVKRDASFRRVPNP